MNAPPQSLNTGLSPIWIFDMLVLAWLILGLFRGRKNGMSGEVLQVLTWIMIVVGCAYAYRPVGEIVARANFFSATWCYRIGYLLVAILIGGVMARIRSALGEKIASSDMFGGGEYYFGMLAGVVRFACMLLMAIALLNAHIPTAAEIGEVDKSTKDLGDVRINPLKIERDILLSSLTGSLSHQYLGVLLIESAAPPATQKTRDTLKSNKQRMLDEITGTPIK